MGNLYNQIATEIISQIDAGAYHIGDKLPGVRSASQIHQVSASTIVAAYDELLDGGYIEARPRSGFYVRSRAQADFLSPKMSQPAMVPHDVVGQQLMLPLLKQTQIPGTVNLGAAVLDLSLLPTVMVEKAIVKAAHQERLNICRYQFPPGNLALRQQIAKRMAQLGCELSVDDIVITNGCQEALLLSIKAITQPGDAVAVESPSYYGILQIIEHLGLKAIEIPTDPHTGISLDALQLAFENWPIKACLVMPNFSNPLGATMSDANKKKLTVLCRKAKVHLIEDDIYGDLCFGAQRPSICKSFDEKVIYCSSFSKTLAPGLRIGWVASRQLADVVSQLKFMSNTGLPGIVQYALVDILASGKYDRHLRSLRTKLAKSTHEMITAIERYFPPNTCITQPRGGFILWAELPPEVIKNKDTFNLALAALDKKIAITPGKVFSANQKYTHCLRLSSSGLWTPEKEKALKEIGKLIKIF
jgi:DNA-binding transcriptional MocR family regulator